jgi:hypothetical protein
LSAWQFSFLLFTYAIPNYLFLYAAPPPLIVSDYLSMMTDTYVLNDYERKFLPIPESRKMPTAAR